MSESVNWRKRELECTRMAADCLQLAGDVQNPALQSHFARMAMVWSDVAVRGPNADTPTACGYGDQARKQPKYRALARTSRR
jgi:hypothetical protein